MRPFWTTWAASLDSVTRSVKGVPIALRTGETRRGVDVALRPGGAITGRVTTENGQPLAMAEVEALRPQLTNNLRVLIPIGRAESNDRGEFSIVGLPPGHYYIAAIDQADPGTEDAAWRIHWAQSFYPGTASAAAAEQVRVESGTTLTDVDFSLLGVSRVSVRGQLVYPDDSELATDSVLLSPESIDGLASSGQTAPSNSKTCHRESTVCAPARAQSGRARRYLPHSTWKSEKKTSRTR